MPVMGGMESTGLIRKYEIDENIPRTPIIALTAHAMIGDKERCLEAGVSCLSLNVKYRADDQMDEYVTKPLRRGDLLASIAKVLTTKIPGTNIPMTTGSVAGLPPISPITGTPIAHAGMSTSTSVRGSGTLPPASIEELPDDPKPVQGGEDKGQTT